MPEIGVYVSDRSGNWIAELSDVTLAEITWELNEPGTASFSIPPQATGADQIYLVDREIQIWFDDDLIWWGVPWAVTGDRQSLTFTCEGLLSLFGKRFIDRTSLVYGNPAIPTYVDQFSIAWDLLDYAQDETVQANRDLNISAATFSPSGIGRTAVYELDEHAMILDLLREFPTMYQGFEYEIVVMGDGARFWTPYYPRKGAAKPQAAMQWDEHGSRHISAFTFQEDANSIATEVYCTGGTVGDQKIEDNYEDTAASAAHGLMQAVISEGSVVDHTWLLDRARKEVELRKDPLITPQISVARTTGMDLFGTVETGDWLPIRIDHGRIQVDAWHRIQTLTWNPDNTMTFGFGEVVAV